MLQVAALLNGPEQFTEQKIAEMVGITRSSVQAIKRNKIKPAMAEIDAKLADYRSKLAARVPIERRVERLGDLIEQTEQPMVALKALVRADYIDGLYCEPLRDQIGDGPPRMPLFSLPPGSRVKITLDSAQEPINVLPNAEDQE